MVQVTAGGGPAASGRGARSTACPDQVPQLPAGLVPGLGVTVIAAAAGDRRQPDLQATQVILSPGVRRGLLVRAAPGSHR
jgi:hypothetical protein